ncbi:MAG TPA: chromosome segregation protein SMC, partial [Polyangiaceae bacterium]|nr:chromosome segregation protein SMC [Polyangiaceae bacterium]
EEKFRVAETQLRDTDTELEQITTLLAGELRAMEEKQAATAALTTQRQEAEQTITAAANDAARIESRISSLRGQVASVSQQRDGAEARLSILSGELDQLTFAFAQFTDRLRDTQAEIDRLLADAELRAAQVAEAETQWRAAQGGLANIDREMRDTQRALAERESKVEVLRHLIDAGEGLSEGTQAVLRGLDNPDFFKPAVAGALAQLIEVEPQHVRAVEAALNGHLQTVVMKDSMVAEAVIQTLTTQQLGRATLALRELQPLVPPSLVEPPTGLQSLRSLVRCGEELAPLLDALLGDTYLATSVEQAVDLRRMYPVSFVTPGGELVTAEGLLIGGAAGGVSNSMLERRNQMHALGIEAEQIRQQVEQATQARQEMVLQIETAQVRLDEAREEKQGVALQISTLRNQLALIEREAKDTERKQQNLEGERASSEARHREAAERMGGLEAEVGSLLEQLDALQARRAEAVNELEVLRAREGELASELNELRVKVATERQRHSSLHHQRAPMEARLVELTELIGQRQQDIIGYQQRAEATVAENAEITANLERLREQVGEGEAAVAALLEERTALAAAAEEISNALRVLRHQLSEAHDQRSRMEVKQTQLEMKLSALNEHIQKRYQIDLTTFERDLHGLRVSIREQLKRQQRAQAGETTESESGEAAAPKPEPAAPAEEAGGVEDAFAIDWERIDTIVRELDQRIDSMGPVNLDAIQEYDELEERHTFLEKQNNDLTNSKAELLETITKINATTRSLFAETFEKIRVNFGEMFVELFGGGKANLVLLDEADPLECGIDIIARPPGKQLTSISLLSGGEKTMTAVALLFSIYMVKPSPFCVLDEMDAPLDESNINRFIKILDRFVEQSQFVVISHNKRTIARADALYGVTMEEHGVSKLVGVKFSKRDESQVSQDMLGTNNPAPVPSVAEAFGKSGNLRSEQLESA